MHKIQKVSIIGTGNLAWNLIHALNLVNVTIVEVFGRSNVNIPHLSGNTRYCLSEDYSALDVEADLVFLAITDDAIGEIANKIPNKQIPVVHLSGSCHIQLLKDAGFENYGVFYPLQTFSKARLIDFSNIPLFLEASSKSLEVELANLARKMSTSVHITKFEQRRNLHVAAVFACNFSNHMLSQAETICKQHNIEFSVLKTLIYETFTKALEMGPFEGQTGPALRNNSRIISEHLKALENQPELSKLYQMITQSIQRMHLGE